MGYTTEFFGKFDLNKPLDLKIKKFLDMFSDSRRMGRRKDPAYGIQGEFFVLEETIETDVIDYNKPPSTQPSLWCNWVPTEDGTGIQWNGSEKFYNYTEWLVYLINKILAPNGYILNGKVDYEGEERSDSGTIEIKDNHVFLDGVEKLNLDEFQTDIVLFFTESND